MALSEKQLQRIEGILKHLDDFMDKRFAQARRINPSAGRAEVDMRLNQKEIMRDILERAKGFGPIRLVVGDILASSDEEKKDALMSTIDQVSLLNEIIPVEEEGGEKTATGQLPIRNIRAYYKSLDPELDSILTLIQMWIWWDLMDAAELYRFDVQEKLIDKLKTIQVDEALTERYRKEMKARPGVEITRQDILKFELQRTKYIIDMFEKRLDVEQGHMVISVTMEREGNPEADASCIRLAKRLMAIEKVRSQGDSLDEGVKQFYAQHLGTSPEQVTARAVEAFEERHAGQERQTLGELLTSGRTRGGAKNYKALRLAGLRKRFEAINASLGVTTKQAQPASA